MGITCVLEYCHETRGQLLRETHATRSVSEAVEQVGGAIPGGTYAGAHRRQKRMMLVAARDTRGAKTLQAKLQGLGRRRRSTAPGIWSRSSSARRMQPASSMQRQKSLCYPRKHSKAFLKLLQE